MEREEKVSHRCEEAGLIYSCVDPWESVWEIRVSIVASIPNMVMVVGGLRGGGSIFLCQG
jgi:hypothetical protein